VSTKSLLSLVSGLSLRVVSGLPFVSSSTLKELSEKVARSLGTLEPSVCKSP
jgi:hypothetical protein